MDKSLLLNMMIKYIEENSVMELLRLVYRAVESTK